MQIDTITVQVRDATSAIAVMTYAIPVYSPVSITAIDPLPAPTQNTAYSYAFSAIGGDPPYLWTLLGAPLVAGWPDPLPGGSIGVPYSYTLSASGGTPPYTFNNIVSGNLPTGLSYNPATGVISGTPTTAVTLDAVTFSVTDSSTGSGGGGTTGANTYFVSSAGVLTGTPGTADTDTVAIEVVDSASQTATYVFTLIVAPATQAATPTFSPAAGSYTGTQNVTISCSTPSSTIYYTTDGTTPTFPVSGTTQQYTAPVVVSVTETINAIGTAAGFTNSNVASATYTISTPQLTALWSDPLQSGSVGAAYSYTLTASGGVPPYSYGISSGALPSGLSLAPSTGVISGTPSATVTADAVTFSVTDSS